MAKYKLSNVAKEDIIRIHHYGIKRFGKKQANLYFDLLFQHFDLIAERPFAFESAEFIRPGYRRCVCKSDSIFYRLDGKTVEIMAIVGRQDLDKIFI